MGDHLRVPGIAVICLWTSSDKWRHHQKKVRQSKNFWREKNSETDKANCVCKCLRFYDNILILNNKNKFIVYEIVFISKVVIKNKYKASSCHLWLYIFSKCESIISGSPDLTLFKWAIFIGGKIQWTTCRYSNST